MQLALQRMKTIGPKKWMKKSAEELEFITMRAELTATKKKLTQNNKSGGGNKPKSKETRPPRKNEGKWAWKGIDSKEGEPHAKVVDKKQYVYCPHHDETKWVLKIGRNGLKHTLNCTKAAETKAGNTSLVSETETPTAQPTRAQLLLAKALASVMADNEDKDDDDSGDEEGL